LPQPRCPIQRATPDREFAPKTVRVGQEIRAFVRDALEGAFGYDARLCGTVAQLVEQGPFKALVLGSSPSRPTLNQSLTLGIISSVRKSYGNISAIMGCPFDVLALVSVTVLKRWSRMVFNS
jgi:hypothetical protein